MTNRHNLKMRLQFLEKEILILQSQLSNAPKGTIVSRRMPDGTYKYYRRLALPNKSYKEFYLGNQNRKEALQLAEKMIAEKKIRDYQNEKRLLQRELAFQEKEPEAEVFLRQHQGIAALLREQEKQSEDPGLKWKNTPYNRSLKYPENLKYTTIVPGLMVRSKSEAMIVASLERHGVPYHYDECIIINGEQIAIDFVCLNVRTGVIYYWDHRGMLDNLNYINKTLYCENLFLNNGYIPWINMIVTTETQDHPLDLQWVDIIIEQYLI